MSTTSQAPAKPRILATPGREAHAFPLLIGRLLASVGQHRATEIVSGERRFGYATLLERIHRLAAFLRAAGVEAGDTVAVMDWDSHRYLECYFAIPMMGAVLQTVNVRLSREVIGFTLRQSGATMLLCHDDFEPVVAALRPDLPGLKRIVRLTDGDEPGSYEALLAEAESTFAFADFDENAIATTFHTTGTTGDPKQVFFTHRQIVLHTLATSATLANQPVGQGLSRRDVYMPMTPLFHVHAWGLPYVATLLGLKQVYPGRYDPATLVALKAREGVTFSHGVPTLLRMVIDAVPAGASLAPWTMIVGGSALSIDLAREAAGKGIVAVAGYGMSETGPIVAIARADSSEDHDGLTRAGFPIPLVEVRTRPDARGELQLRAPWLTAGYGVQDASDALWEGGWLHTQDIAERDPDGALRIVDRMKDVIKTGGEWVSSIEIEGLLVAHPAVAEAAVVAIPSEKWGERPKAFIIVAQGYDAPTTDELRSFLAGFAAEGRISAFAVPDAIVVRGSLPRTSVGKIDKKLLRLAD